MEIHVPKLKPVAIIREESRVVVVVDGKRALDLSYDAARQLGRLLIAQGSRAEEIVKHDKVAFDSAASMRSGLGLGFANDKRVAEIARHKAQHDDTLRKAMPSSMRMIQSERAVLAPTITGTPPKKKEDEAT